MNRAESLSNDFVKCFRSMCSVHSPWEVWNDFIEASSVALNIFKTEESETNIQRITGKYDDGKMSELFSLMCQAMEAKPDQDFLGHSYMVLELKDKAKGQYFTPYSVCQAMARLTMESSWSKIQKELEEKGYIGIADPACGAGAMMVSARNWLQEKGVPWYRIWFHGQDLSALAARMCHIQLSLLGCVGIVCIGDTLASPAIFDALWPVKAEGRTYLATPMWGTDLWQERIFVEKLKQRAGRRKVQT